MSNNYDDSKGCGCGCYQDDDQGTHGVNAENADARKYYKDVAKEGKKEVRKEAKDARKMVKENEKAAKEYVDEVVDEVKENVGQYDSKYEDDIVGAAKIMANQVKGAISDEAKMARDSIDNRSEEYRYGINELKQQADSVSDEEVRFYADRIKVHTEAAKDRIDGDVAEAALNMADRASDM